jgi:hypothetical protein
MFGRVFIAGLVTWVVVAAAPAQMQTATDRAAPSGVEGPVTFSKDIAPILQRSCQQCHRPDSIAPMSLLTYQQARPYARAMKQRTLLARSQFGRGAMPPWFIEKNIGIQKFKEDISLSDEEIALIGKWADAGAPEGNRADMPPPRVFANAAEWNLGKPDVIIKSPSTLVKGTAPDWWGNPWDAQPIGLTEDRYIASVEYKEVIDSRGTVSGPQGSLYVIHHATAGIGGPLGSADAATGGGDAEADGGSGLPIHEVGRNGDLFPDDAGRLVKANGTIVWGNVHLHPSGVKGDDRMVHIEVGLRLHPKGYTPRYESKAAGFGRSELEIRANEPNQKIESFWVAPQPVRLVNFEPHLHAAGIRMCLEAIYQRSIETLNCAGYDHNWVKNYSYDDDSAPLLPKGTILRATAWFDSTPRNLNIVDPRNATNWGRRTVVNMLMAFEQMVFLTDEQYHDLLAKRRQYLDRTQGWDTLVGCPGCWDHSK